MAGDKKRKKNKSGIRRRWTLNSLAATLLVVVVGLSTITIALTNYYYTTMLTSMEARASSNASFFSKNYMTSYEEYYNRANNVVFEFRDSDKLELQFINSAGRLENTTNSPNSYMLPVTGQTMLTPDVQKALTTGETTNWIGNDPITGERVMAVSSPLLFNQNQIVGVMRFVSSMEPTETKIIQMLGIATAVSVLLLLLIIFTNLLFLRSIIVPISEINSATKRIASGGYGTRIDKTYNDEIGELVDSINEMSGEIRAAERMKSDFISSVSHELRTPLTAISGWGETLMSADISDPAEIKKGVRIMLKETARLSKMVEELLDFTRVDSGRMTLNVESFALTESVEEIVYLHMDSLARSGITLELLSPDYDLPMVLGDRERLKQVFINVLDNAAKHGGSGKRILVRVFYDKPWVTITVRDYGGGIPADELPHVKYKFYKGSSVARGNGIGLAISDEIMRLHEGSLDIESTVGEGTMVTLRLPAQEELLGL